MNRLQKKCFVVCASMHFLLLVILFVAPAFVTSKREDIIVELPLLTVIPDKLTDDPFSSGSASAEAAPPVEPVLPRAEPQPREVPLKPSREPVTPKPEPVSKPAPPKPETTKVPVPKPEAKREKPKPERPKIEISREKVPPSRDTSQSQSAADQVRQQQQYAANLNSIAQRLSRNLSSATTVSVPGLGQEAYANYTQVVKSMYYQAWVAPPEMAGSSKIVHARVEIARDGTVISARITKGSGDSALDDSVRRALELKFIRPFPEGAKDLKRVFEIGFTLKSR